MPPEMLYEARSSLLSRVFFQLCPQAVMVRHFSVLLFPSLNITTVLVVRRSCCTSKISLAQIAVIEQTNASLRQTFGMLSFWSQQLPQDVAKMGQFYMQLDAKPEMKDGDIPYPRSGYDKSIGMSIEFRYVMSIQ